MERNEQAQTPQGAQTAAREKPSLVRQYLAEMLTATATVMGWVLITWGLAELLTAWLWPISMGGLLLGLAGWRFVWRVLTDGLYVLTKKED